MSRSPSEFYVGEAFQMEPSPAAMLAELPANERPAAERSWECAQVAGYLSERNYPAVAFAMLGLEHNNAEYIEQYGELPPNWRTAVNQCAQFFGAEKVKAAWNAMSRDQRGEHLAHVRAELARVTEGKPGTSLVCSPAVPRAECVRRLRKEIDRATCKGVSVPMGPPGFSVCVPRWLIWGGAAVVGLLVINAVRR